MNGTITLPRSVVEQALEAFTRGCPPDCKDGMTDSGGVYPWGEPALIRCPACRAFDALRAALEQPQVEHEPVAWMWKFEFDEGAAFSTKEPTISICDGVEYVPLYTHPQPKREPLTDEAEHQCPYPKANPSTRNAWLDGWEAAERAHGIGGDA